MPASEALFRWIHIVAGIMWIGHLYFFNFVNASFAATMDAETRKKVVPQLVPRALYWFRWGAAWTWITGVLLLLIAFYHTRAVLDDPFQGWSGGAIVMLVVTLLAFYPYDVLWKSALAKDARVGAAVSYVGVVVIVLLYIYWGHFSYRGYVIHTGALFGTIMAANVWMRIWPMQRRIITAVRDGTPADPSWAPLAGLRSRHNVYMSVPLVWTMINAHTTVPYANSPVYLFVVILVGWAAVYLLYKNVPRVPGF
jgi:uncharacterized membrane protein